MKIEIILDTQKIVFTEDAIREGMVRGVVGRAHKIILKDDKKLVA